VERQQLAARIHEDAAEYWLLATALSPDSVLAFYRRAATRRGWTIELDRSPWLQLARRSFRYRACGPVTEDRSGSTLITRFGE